jgi:hypothetical protein
MDQQRAFINAVMYLLRLIQEAGDFCKEAQRLPVAQGRGCNMQVGSEEKFL